MSARRPPQDHTGAFASGDRFVLEPVAIARTPYKERYGTPHQASETRGTREGAPAEGTIELLPRIPIETLRDLEGFERLWVIYVFHLNEGWSPLVRPPRGPRLKRGLFATRSPHRPSPIGLSAVRLLGIEGRKIRVRELDLLDGTPILDLKPYVPYCDAFPDAKAGWVDAIEASEAEASEVAASEAEAGEAEASEAEAGEAEASAEASEAEASEAGASEAGASEAEAGEAGASEAGASEAKASEAEGGGRGPKAEPRG